MFLQLPVHNTSDVILVRGPQTRFFIPDGIERVAAHHQIFRFSYNKVGGENKTSVFVLRNTHAVEVHHSPLPIEVFVHLIPQFNRALILPTLR
jgi:hypothetical protein